MVLELESMSELTGFEQEGTNEGQIPEGPWDMVATDLFQWGLYTTGCIWKSAELNEPRVVDKWQEPICQTRNTVNGIQHIC